MCETKRKKRNSKFYSKEREIRKVVTTGQPILVLLYKELYFNTKEIDESLPVSIWALLQEFEDVFLEDVPKGLLPLRDIEYQSTSYRGSPFQINQRIRVTRRRLKNCNNK